MHRDHRNQSSQENQQTQSVNDAPGSTAVIGLACILLAIFFVYRPALSGPLIWDDEGNTTRPALQSVAGLYRMNWRLSRAVNEIEIGPGICAHR